ncbi:NADH:ubiquinone oxidoreductase subunit [Humitalea rosea]|uniref:NADH:ubiquinone oxidoreductase subunit n=1 Tax=Humitalea rosea TaxID=990373 RepID=A0A2W7HV92_9PROT|nr:NADH-ubiquinone oxidoreductase subunit NDUFA12 family protein [Humitalea rosea]PZW38661.1 NADH:ubiquinone oxidoreductase subunit [Humitalea rosea]
MRQVAPDPLLDSAAMSFFSRLTMRLSGRAIGTDRFGNRYFESRADMPGYGRKRRWVAYNGAPDSTTVPAEWHAWLHHTTAAPLDESKRLPWQLEHQRNLTGTPLAWRPKGADAMGGARLPTAGDYEAWTP